MLRTAGKLLAEVSEIVNAAVLPGVDTAELDSIVRKEIKKRNAVPSFLGYGNPPFPGAVCVSINETVVHGIPDGRILKDGDIVGLDIGLVYEGLYADMSVTVPVGSISTDVQKLVNATQDALYEGMRAGAPGKTVGDIGHAIESIAKQRGYGVVRELTGHGVGTAVHEDPSVPNYGKSGKGFVIRDGEVLALEPMFTLHGDTVRVAPNGWDIITADGSVSAHCEHTILYSSHRSEPFIITSPESHSDDDCMWFPE